MESLSCLTLYFIIDDICDRLLVPGALVARGQLEDGVHQLGLASLQTFPELS